MQKDDQTLLGWNGNSPEENISLSDKLLKKRTGLALPTGLPLDVWKHIGRQIFTISDASSWWLGDWLLYGERTYPDRYKRAVAEICLDYQTLRNYSWVARKVDPSRRRERLSFQHHAEVARLSKEEQESWLAKAESARWSRNELRKQIRVMLRSQPSEDRPAAVQIRVKMKRRHRWQYAADLAGQELNEWITTTLDDAALAIMGE